MSTNTAQEDKSVTFLLLQHGRRIAELEEQMKKKDKVIQSMGGHMVRMGDELDALRQSHKRKWAEVKGDVDKLEDRFNKAIPNMEKAVGKLHDHYDYVNSGLKEVFGWFWAMRRDFSNMKEKENKCHACG